MFISKYRFISMWILAAVVFVIAGTCDITRAAEPGQKLNSEDTRDMGRVIRHYGYTCDTADVDVFFSVMEGDQVFLVCCVSR